MGKVLVRIDLPQPNDKLTADDIKTAFGLTKGDIDEAWAQNGVARISTDGTIYAIMIEEHALNAITKQAPIAGRPTLTPQSNPRIGVFGR